MGRLARFIHFYTDEDDGADVGPTNIVSGNPPLSLVNAIAKKIRRLTQYGKCTVSGTDITCNNGVLKYDSELGIYADGTPEEIKVSASGADDQTATASNLFAVGSVTDEQDIISGTITRRCEAVVSDGTTPSGRYIGTVGEGNIIVQTKETGYSGAIASFTADKAEPLSGLVAEINPVQDLHGYDNPWPAGGGKNIAPTVVGGSMYGVTCTVRSDGSVLLNGTASGGNASFFSEYFTLKAGTYKSNGVPAGGMNNYVFYFDGVSGSANVGGEITINVPEDVRTRTVVQVYPNGTANNITIYPMLRDSSVTDATYAPYANECPISGWTGLEGQRTGANVLNPSLYLFQTRTQNGLTYTVQQDGTVKVTGTATATGGPSFTSNFKLKPGTYRWLDEAGQGVVCAYRKYPAGSSSSTHLSNPFTTDGTDNIYLNMYCNTVGTYDLVVHPQISVGSDVVGFTPYTGEPISVSWQSEAGTVYGGTDEVISGNGTSTMGMVDLGDLTWGYSASDTVFYATIADKKDGDAGIICSQYKSGGNTGFSTPDYTVGFSSVLYNVKRIFIGDPNYTDVTSFKSAMAGVQLCYQLETPQSFSHDPVPISTIYGQNNIWVDTGNVSAYVPDFTTEKVAVQSLSTTEGTNTVFVTSNVDPVELEVEYRTP